MVEEEIVNRGCSFLFLPSGFLTDLHMPLEIAYFSRSDDTDDETRAGSEVL